ncbi:hypothetical protein [Streptomyces griseoruber]|nr:hypothetical protein [Streptomyces griseoruber]
MRIVVALGGNALLHRGERVHGLLDIGTLDAAYEIVRGRSGA